MIDLKAISAIVDSNASSCVSLSDRLWDIAETAYTEFRSAEACAALLSRHGFSIEWELGGIPTAFSARFGDIGPSVGFLGEFDALPGLSQRAGTLAPAPLTEGGNGHGCGHNLLGGATVLAALSLAAWLKAEGLPGRVVFFGCPAEEGGAGKTFMAREGAFDGLDAALTWHPASVLAIDAMRTLATAKVRFAFTSPPDRGPFVVPPADAVTLTSIGANYLREHLPTDVRLHYAIPAHALRAGGGGGRWSEVVYQVRSPSLAGVRDALERLRLQAEGAALMTGTTVTSTVERATSNMVPNDVLSDLMDRIIAAMGPVAFTPRQQDEATRVEGIITPSERAESLAMFGTAAAGIDEALHTGILPRSSMPALLPVSTDVGDVSWIVPTARCFGPCYAIGTPFHSWKLVLQGKSDIAHQGMVHSAKILAATGAAVIADPALRSAAWHEIEAARRLEPYVCPIPPDIAPPVESEHIE